MEMLSLFVAAFLAATILPFSSEAALVLAITEGMPKSEALLVASLGNIAAVLLNYALGYFLYTKMKKKLIGSKTGKKAYMYGKKYAYCSLLLSWLPVIGDPLTIVGGLLRLNIVWFVIITGSLRIGRYIFVASMI